MTRWSTIILVLGLIFAVLAFGGLVASAIAAILKIVVVVLVVLFLVSLVIGRRRAL